MSPNELAANGTTGLPGNAPPSWKQELNDKIAAARARRQAARPAVDAAAKQPSESNSRAARVAAAVAARYADAPTYSEYLASEVRAAVIAAANQARANGDPEVASADVVAAAPVAKALPAFVDEIPAPPPSRPVKSPAKSKPAPSRPSTPAPRVDYAGFPYATRPTATPAPTPSRQAYKPAPPDLSDPVADALITPATPLPAKLIEFPRELIATRRARPRHAEGPLREDACDETGQLRIFEVEASTISTTAEPAPQVTEWSSIRLDAYPADYIGSDTPVTGDRSTVAYPPADHRPYNQRVAHAQSQLATHPVSRLRRPAFELEVFPQMAALSDRLMAGIVDAALVGIAFLLFVFVFAACTAHALTGRPALIAGAVVFLLFYLLYQLLFFTFAEGTPGMRYARIALCTFDDGNPTRDAMRKRIFALVLAAAPLGLGFLYAFFDEDHLGWHDRMTRMYQRSYK